MTLTRLSTPRHDTSQLTPLLAHRLAMCLGVIVLVLCARVSSAQPADPIVGTWKLNLAKSTYVTPAPKSTTVTIAPAGKGYAFTVEMVGADGQPQKWGYTSDFNGQESAVWGTPAIDAVVARTTGNGSTVVYKKGGKVVTTTTSAVADDGRTFTVTITLFDAQGKELTNRAVYERQ